MKIKVNVNFTCIRIIVGLLFLIITLLFITMVKSLTKITKVHVAKTKVNRNKLSMTENNTVLSTDTSDYAFQCLINDARRLPKTRGDWDVAAGIEHLIGANSKFLDIIMKYGLPSIYSDTSTNTSNDTRIISINKHYHSLLKIIVYQQLSAKSAEPIFQRLLQSLQLQSTDIIDPKLMKKADASIIYVAGKKKISINGIICGLSESKLKYILDLTDHFLDSTKLLHVNLHELNDIDLRNKLLSVKGLGLWSVDMFMLFDLHRSNILPIGDLAIRKSLSLFFDHNTNHFESKKNQALIPDLCSTWSPYSSLATLYLWKMVSNNT